MQDEKEAVLIDLAQRTVTNDAADVVILAGAPLAGLANKIRDRVPVPLVDGIQAAVAMAEGLVRMNPRKATAGTYRRPAPKDSKGLRNALADVIGHRDRDLKGYGRTPPDPQWPGGARVAVSFVINFEEGAEMSLSAGDAQREGLRGHRRGLGVPDRCMESHFEYGTKAAWWRIADTLERLGVPATVSTCGKAAELSPWLIEDAVKRGHEISCHGWRWEKHAHMEEAEEREAIASTVNVLTEIAGTRPVGWHTRSTPSPNTRRLLVEEGGFLYDSDDYSDDLPFFVEVRASSTW